MTITRRKLVQSGAVLGSAAIAAPAIISRKALASSGEINVYAWGDYIQDNIRESFEKETGIKVNLSTYASNDEVQNKLRAAGGKGYDIIFPSVDTLPDYEEGDLLSTIDESKINMDHIISSILRDTIKLGAVKRGDRIALPFTWGTEAITYNSKVHDFSNGVSYADLWEGNDKQAAIRQRSALSALALLLDANGTEPSNRALDIYKSESDMRRVMDKCLAYAIANKARIGAYWDSAPEATSAFTDAGCTIGQTWDTTGVLLNRENPDWQYTMPKEGGLGWIDTMAIPSGAENIEQTYAFINHLIQPEVGAMFTNNTGYNSASKGSMDLLEDKDLVATLQSIYNEEAVANIWWWQPQTPYFSELRQNYAEKLTNA